LTFGCQEISKTNPGPGRRRFPFGVIRPVAENPERDPSRNVLPDVKASVDDDRSSLLLFG
jgi:hypothetical protein